MFHLLDVGTWEQARRSPKRRSLLATNMHERAAARRNRSLLMVVVHLNDNDVVRSGSPGVVLDRRLRPVIDTREPAPARSLNLKARRGEAQRVARENGALLARLVACRGAYSAAAWRAAARDQARAASQRVFHASQGSST